MSVPHLNKTDITSLVRQPLCTLYQDEQKFRLFFGFIYFEPSSPFPHDERRLFFGCGPDGASLARGEGETASTRNDCLCDLQA